MIIDVSDAVNTNSAIGISTIISVIWAAVRLGRKLECIDRKLRDSVSIGDLNTWAMRTHEKNPHWEPAIMSRVQKETAKG